MQVNKEADDGAEQHVSPVKHCVKKAGRYMPPASQSVPKDDNVAIQLLDLILSDPTKFGRFIPFLPISCTLQLHNCFISIQPHLLTQSNIIPHSPPLIEVDCHSADATDIAASFKVGSMTQGIFIDAFASLLFKDEMRDNPETFGKKIFIPTSVSVLHDLFITFAVHYFTFIPTSFSLTYICSISSTSRMLLDLPKRMNSAHMHLWNTCPNV